MKYVAAYALLVLGGNAHPTVDQISTLITSVSGTVEKDKVTALHASLQGKDLNAVIASGLSKVGSIGAASAPAPAAVSAPVAAAVKKEEPKKEEPKKEDDDFEGAGDLFDF